MTPVYLSAPGLCTPLGDQPDIVADALFAARPALQAQGDWLPDRPAWVGAVTTPLPALPPAWQSRNNQLLAAAFVPLAPVVATVSATLRARTGEARIGVVLGSSTSGIAEGERALGVHEATGQLPADFDYSRQEVGDPARFLAAHAGVSGPAWTLSTACTSSTLAFLSARRMLQTGLADAVLVGGADSLCRLTLNGFLALASLSAERSRPFDAQRDGINIGEGAVLFLMSREPFAGVPAIRLSGGGVASDAWHISAPHPEGVGAEAALRAALADAGLRAGDVNYVNLHATGTDKNDAMEALVMARVFGEAMPCSATKPLTGHLLGAAGALEVAFCWLALARQRLIPQAKVATYDARLPFLGLVEQAAPTRLRHVLTSNYAFGGSNAALILSRDDV